MIEAFFRHILEKNTIGQLTEFQKVGGGCINETAKLSIKNQSYFIKWNTEAEMDLFEKEALGLELLRQHSSLQIPAVLDQGSFSNKSYLLMEWIDEGSKNDAFWRDFGTQLASIHKNIGDLFGLDHKNYIGRLPQSNNQHTSWTEFFVNERLLPQIKRAFDHQLIDQNLVGDFEKLYPRLHQWVPEEPPSLLHGDLWSGNYLCDQHGKPVLIDPAVHYGHRETEIAFTKLFGGFDQLFYQAYEEEYPLEHGFNDRTDLHNLYPLLVHLNLFGASYLQSIIRTLKRFI